MAVDMVTGTGPITAVVSTRVMECVLVTATMAPAGEGATGVEVPAGAVAGMGEAGPRAAGDFLWPDTVPGSA